MTENDSAPEEKKEDFVLKPGQDRGIHSKEARDRIRREKKQRAKNRIIARKKVSVARLSVASNFGLLVIKLILGLTMGSMSVISEGIHSGMDLLAAIIALMAVGSSMKPADQDHSYGHGKYEPISGTVEAILIFIAAILIIYESVLKFMGNQHVELLEGGILVMLISVIVNIALTRLLMQVTKKTESLALEADAVHHYTDVWTSVGVLAGLIVIRLTGWFILDPIVAIAVALMIIKAAYDLTKRTFEDLSDMRIPEEEEQMVRDILNKHDHIIHDYHNLRTRRSGHSRHIDLHMVVSRELGLVETHRVCDHIEMEIKKNLPNSQILIHCEPCNGKCDHCDEQAVCDELKRVHIEKLKDRKVEANKDASARHDEKETMSIEDRKRVEVRVARILRGYEEVVSYHNVTPKCIEGKLVLTLHVLVRAKITVERTHEIDHALERGLRQLYPDLEVMAHMEPCDGECITCDIEDCTVREVTS